MTRKYDHLYENLTSYANLFCAFLRAARGKRGQPAVAEFDCDQDARLFELQDQLRAHTYRPGAYYSFYITDPKRRLVSAAPFRDRVVHHALCNVIEPLFERAFIGDSYANRIGKGTHAALDRARGWARAYRYVLQCDLRQCFPSIDHAVLRGVLQRKIDDEEVLWLCDRILESGAGVLAGEYDMVYFPGDDLFAAARPRGLPIGNLTSQFWANVLLNELDQFVKRRLHCTPYLRYVDDFLLFSDSKTQLWEWKRAIVDFLAGLRLTLHEAESTVYPCRTGIPFLGFRLYPDHVRLQRKNGVAFSRRLRRSYRELARGLIDVWTLEARVRGWVAHAAYGDTWRLRLSLLGGHSVPPRGAI